MWNALLADVAKREAELRCFGTVGRACFADVKPAEASVKAERACFGFGDLGFDQAHPRSESHISTVHVSCMHATSKLISPHAIHGCFSSWGNHAPIRLQCLHIGFDCRQKNSAQHRLALALEMGLIKFASATCLGADANPSESGVWRKEWVCCWQPRTKRIKRWVDEHKIHRPRAAAAWQHSPG